MTDPIAEADNSTVGAAGTASGSGSAPGASSGGGDHLSGAPQTVARERIPRELWVLIAAAFTIAIGYGFITPVLPQFAQSFGVDATASSIVVSAFAFFRLIFAPGGGRLIARFGERPTYIAGLLIVALSTAATAFAHSYWQLLLFRGLGGIGSIMFSVSAVALLVRLAPPSIRGRVSSAYGSAFLLGGIGGPVLGGALGSFGLQVPFLGYAVLLLVAAALVTFLIHPAALRPAADAPERAVFTVREALQDTAYRSSLAASFANGWANFGVRNAIVPLFVAAAIGTQTWMVGAVLAVFALGNAAGLSMSGRLSDHRGRRPFIIIGLLVSGVATVLTGLAGNLPVLIAISIIAGLGSGVFAPAQQAALADVVGQERNGGPALAAYQMLSDLGGIIGPIAAGLMVDHGSYGLAFGVSGVLTVLAAGPWLKTRETLEAKAIR